jgi:DNA-binding CsgD family transcriptional regulator
MRLAGAWPKALAEAEYACNWMLQSAKTNTHLPDSPPPPIKYPIGAAFYELGEMHRVRGDFAKAEDAYRQASQYGQSPEPGLALLRLSQGKVKVAEGAIRTALAKPQNRLVQANVLAGYVEIMIAAGDLSAARTGAEELSKLSKDLGAPFLRALSAQSNGSIALAEGDAHIALSALREAWMLWQDLEAPYEAARVRVQLGLGCRALGDEDGAELELDAARSVFQRLDARPDLTRIDTLSVVEPQHTSKLTAREREVIRLVATGKSNRAIAKQLSISERTVDRHVSNILLKLELPSRSAATAYAYEHGLV